MAAPTTPKTSSSDRLSLTGPGADLAAHDLGGEVPDDARRRGDQRLDLVVRLAVTGQRLPVPRVCAGDTVRALRQALSAADAEVSPVGGSLCLLARGRVLPLTDSLGASGLKDGDVIDVVRCESLVATASDDWTARVWSADSGRCLLCLEGHGDAVHLAVLSPDCRTLITASYDTTAKVWSVADGTCLRTLEGHDDGVNSAAVSPDGRFVATASMDCTARVWDMDTGKCLLALLGHTGEVVGVCFSSDGVNLVTASHDQHARLWKAADGDCTRVLDGHTASVYWAAFSPEEDPCWVVTASQDCSAKLWGTETGSCVATFLGHSGRVYWAVFSPDGVRVATASEDGSARIWHASTGECTRILSMSGPVGEAAPFLTEANTVSFSPDGRRVIVACDDAVARVFCLASGEVVLTLTGHTGPVVSALFAT